MKAETGRTKHEAPISLQEAAERNQIPLRKAHQEHVNDILKDSEETGEIRKFWKYIKSKKQDSQGVAPSEQINSSQQTLHGKLKKSVTNFVPSSHATHQRQRT